MAARESGWLVFDGVAGSRGYRIPAAWDQGSGAELWNLAAEPVVRRAKMEAAGE